MAGGRIPYASESSTIISNLKKPGARCRKKEPARIPIFVCFQAIPNGVQDLHLAPCSGVTLGRVQETILGVRMESKSAICKSSSLLYSLTQREHLLCMLETLVQFLALLESLSIEREYYLSPKVWSKHKTKTGDQEVAQWQHAGFACMRP